MKILITETQLKKLLNENQEYLVKQGDTLSKIAKRYNTTVSKIKQDNNISNIDVINVGQKLIINSNNTPTSNKSTKTTVSSKSPFKNKEEGNKFRQWVNSTLPKTAKKFDLDVTGSFNNANIINTWNAKLVLKSGKTTKLGDYYLSTTKKQENKVMSNFNPDFENQINFAKLSTTGKTNAICKPNDKECAQFINDASDDIAPGAIGSAWLAYNKDTLLGKTIYSAFKGLDSKTSNEMINLWQKMNKRKVKYTKGVGTEFSENIKNIVNRLVPTTYEGPKLKEGDIVGLYYKDSENHERAFYEGGIAWFTDEGQPGKNIKSGNGWGMNTHIGRVFLLKDGIPLVFHNVGGNVISQPYNTLRIAWVKRK